MILKPLIKPVTKGLCDEYNLLNITCKRFVFTTKVSQCVLLLCLSVTVHIFVNNEKE